MHTAMITCRTFDDVELYPGPNLNVIVGPNGKQVQVVVISQRKMVSYLFGKGSPANPAS